MKQEVKGTANWLRSLSGLQDPQRLADEIDQTAEDNIMHIEVWRCACGMNNEYPWKTCFRCSPNERRQEAVSFRDASIEARLIDVDPYCDGILARTAGGSFIRVRDVGIALRVDGIRSREELIAKAQLLADENKEVLAENARLRRQLERGGSR